MISFVMPAYKSQFLYDAIASIMAQTASDWELIIVDDCSPENLKSVVDKFDDNRISYCRNEKNIGGKNLVSQWNYSVSLAHGDWIVLAADDDLYSPSFAAECSRLIEKYPAVDLVRSRVLQIDEKGNPLWEDGTLSEFTDKFEYLHDWLTAKAFTCVGNFVFRRSALERIGGFYDYPCAYCSDIATPIALSQNGVANTSEMLFCFRHSSIHLTADTSRFWEKMTATTKLFKWLMALDYEEPDNDAGKAFHSIHNDKYLHDKCVYDYFNQVVKYLPFGSLPRFLGHCELATGFEKFKMVLRWIKHKL